VVTSNWLSNPNCYLDLQNHQNWVIAKEKRCAAALNLKQSQRIFIKIIEIESLSVPLRNGNSIILSFRQLPNGQASRNPVGQDIFIMRFIISKIRSFYLRQISIENFLVGEERHVPLLDPRLRGDDR
jgi:hypothetical protein